jgi:hypothetical protein
VKEKERERGERMGWNSMEESGRVGACRQGGAWGEGEWREVYLRASACCIGGDEASPYAS